jgi:hypothetical protein
MCLEETSNNLPEDSPPRLPSARSGRIRTVNLGKKPTARTRSAYSRPFVIHMDTPTRTHTFEILAAPTMDF